MLHFRVEGLGFSDSSHALLPCAKQFYTVVSTGVDMDSAILLTGLDNIALGAAQDVTTNVPSCGDGNLVRHLATSG